MTVGTGTCPSCTADSGAADVTLANKATESPAYADSKDFFILCFLVVGFVKQLLTSLYHISYKCQVILDTQEILTSNHKLLPIYYGDG